MLEGIKHYIFFIIDQENKGVLGYTHSASVANIAAKGVTNSSVMLIPAASFDKSILDSYNDNFKNNYKLVKQDTALYTNSKMMTSECNVCELSKELSNNKSFDLQALSVTNSWLEKRKTTAFRINKLKILETICDRYLTRFKSFTGDSFFYQYIGQQLENVDLKNNYFPASIIEWADISNITPTAAYYDLKMLYDSAGISVVRVNAVWKKYADMIISTNGKQEFDDLDIISRAETEFRFGERL